MTSIIFEPKVSLLDDMVQPDSYVSSARMEPPEEFVVSKNRDGTAASTYGELCWNWTPYSPTGHPNKLYFSYWKDDGLSLERAKLVSEMHWVMFLLIWKQDGAPLAYHTLYLYLKMLRKLAKYCESHSIQIRDVLNDDVRLIKAAEEMGRSSYRCLAGLVLFLFRLGPEQVGFSLVGTSTHMALNRKMAEYNKNLKQHPPIPTRIYSLLISTLSNELNDFEAVEKRYLSLAADCASDPQMGRSYTQQRIATKRNNIAKSFSCPTFPELLHKFGLEEYFVKKGLDRDIRGLVKGLSEILAVARFKIIAFSGMRNGEALSLPYHCLEEERHNGKAHHFIMGQTTKLNHGKMKRTRWVTNGDGARAIRIVQKVATMIYRVNGVKPAKTNQLIDKYPLFVSPAYLGLVGFRREKKPGVFVFSEQKLNDYPTLRKRLQPLIEEDNLQELEQIDPHRAWRSEKDFRVGNPWRFTAHQLRRSLALYAQRSGLVSLPSLRRQLQHITQEMSQYYAKGSAFARNFVADDNEHFGKEWQKTIPVSSALSYIINVVLSDDTLFGGHGNYIAHRLKGDKTVVVDRDAIMRRFQKGEIAYKETPLGGCVKVGECDDVGLKLLGADCIKDCPNLVGKLAKLERVIVAQTNLVSKIDPTSIEFRMEKSDLDVLISARDKVVERQRGTA